MFLLFTLDKKSHKGKLEDLQKALPKNGLKISPEKCQLLRKICNIWARTFFYKRKEGVCKSHEKEDRGNPKIETSYYPQSMQEFCWTTYLFKFVLSWATKPVKTSIWLNKKRKSILLGEWKTGSFWWNQKFTIGSALYHIQNGQSRLTAHASKRKQTAAQSYSISELEVCGLAINNASYLPFVKESQFWCCSNHLALTHIIKSKSEPANNKIKRLLGAFSSYTFSLYYLKGKDMILSDFLSRMEGDKSNPHEVIPISFNSHSILTGHYYTFLKFHQKHTE